MDHKRKEIAHYLQFDNTLCEGKPVTLEKLMVTLMVLSCILIGCEAETEFTIRKLSIFIPLLRLGKTFKTTTEAFAELGAEDKIDIAIIDIDGIKESSLSKINTLSPILTSIIFVSRRTSPPDFQPVGIRCDFLTKPLTLSGLQEAIFRSTAYGIEIHKIIEREYDYFFVKLNGTGRLEQVSFMSIVAFEVLGNILKIHMNSHSIETHIRMKNIDAMLNGNPDFIRIHRSFIVAKRHIVAVEDQHVQMSNSKLRIPVSNTYLQKFNAFINSKLLFRKNGDKPAD